MISEYFIGAGWGFKATAAIIIITITTAVAINRVALIVYTITNIIYTYSLLHKYNPKGLGLVIEVWQ